MFDIGCSSDNVVIKIAIVVLGEEDQIGGAILIDSDVDSGQLVHADIMVAHRQHHRNHVLHLVSEGLVQSEIVVPGVGTGGHVVIIGHISAQEEDVWLQCGDLAVQFDGCICVA